MGAPLDGAVVLGLAEDGSRVAGDPLGAADRGATVNGIELLGTPARGTILGWVLGVAVSRRRL